jgi:hypothetical protein
MKKDVKMRASKRRDDVILACSMLSDGCARSFFYKRDPDFIGLRKEYRIYYGLTRQLSYFDKKSTIII